jgi:hypothetical protein
MPQTPAATGVEEIVDEETLIVVIFVALTIHNPAARRLLIVETRCAHRSHGCLPFLVRPIWVSRKLRQAEPSEAQAINA